MITKKCLTSILSLILLISCASQKKAEQKPFYFQKMERLIESNRKNSLKLVPLAEEAATRILAGGKLWSAGERAMVSEFSWRSGGLMMMRWLDENQLKDKDVVLYFESHGVPDSILTSKKLATSKAMLVKIDTETMGLPKSISNALMGSMFVGELIAAFTREGKMPVIFETIGRYDGHPRIVKYKSGEIPFHEKTEVKPIKAGKLANQYLDVVQKILHRIQKEEWDKIVEAGDWLKHSKQKPHLYIMGHMTPVHVMFSDLSQKFQFQKWSAGFSSAQNPPPKFSKDDTILYMGSHYAPLDLMSEAKKVGAKLIYVSAHEDRDYKKDSSVIWIDPMWPWFEAGVEIEGYDVPVLAVSGIINTVLLWELASAPK